jgi:hypothetical protein
MHPLGALPVKPDYRDWPARLVIPASTTITEKFHASPIMLDQGGYGTCVANAWTHLLTGDPIQHPGIRKLDPARQPSYAKLGSSAYWTNPLTGKVDYQGDAYKAENYAVRLYDAIHDGVRMPLDPERDDGAYTQLGGDILKERGLISGYYRAMSADEVVTAILTHGPVVFASPWYASMDSPVKHADGSRWLNVDPSTPIRGYHAYLLDAAVTGVNGWVRNHNSWGPMWSPRGSARISIPDLQILFMGQAFIATERA